MVKAKFSSTHSHDNENGWAYEVRNLAVYLRYFTLKPLKTTKLHYRYKDIAIMTGLSVSQVTQFCLGALPGNEERYGPKKRYKKYNLTKEQL